MSQFNLNDEIVEHFGEQKVDTIEFSLSPPTKFGSPLSANEIHCYMIIHIHTWTNRKLFAMTPRFIV